METEIENPRIRPICELVGLNFFIPRYQRGYRWGEQEITELLDDILQYYKSTIVQECNRESKISKFYCLQPIVVKKKNWQTESNEKIEGWELIDGQQRLATLFIILSYLEKIREDYYDNKTDIYFIDFETRENCKDFFDNKKFTSEINYSNVDFYHISKGYEYVKEWFKDKLVFRLHVLETILNTINNVSVIWYEAKEDNHNTTQEDSSIDLFTRLNDGKIPLTDSELIKALLLQGDRYPSTEQRYVNQRLFEIASEWDEIEATLQDEKMWYFLNDTTYQPSSKIESIFKLLAEKWNEGNAKKFIQFEEKEGKPKHFEYLVFDRYLLKKREHFQHSNDQNKYILDPINEIWKEVKETFSLFLEWYEDNTLYHYIGYLLAIKGKNKEKLISELLLSNLTKTGFVKFLKKEIATVINIKKKKENSLDLKTLKELTYGTDNPEIINILLLFNVETLIKHHKENARFPFHLYKKEEITSIEHIHPQNPDDIDTDLDRSTIWLRSHKDTLSILITNVDEEQKKEIEKCISGMNMLILKFDKDQFKNIYISVIELYTKISGIKENKVHTLYNLALVDKDTNSALNNSFFDIKREILKNKKLRRYIPICTQRAFSKYYSSSPQEMIFWRNEDRKSYFDQIEVMYNSFIKLI